MRLAALTRVDRNARRLTEILTVLGRYGLADWLGGLNYEWLQGRLVSKDGERLGKLTREARIRMALTEMGTTFVKLGQMLSTRIDLIGPTLAAELAQLQSGTPPDAAGAVRATISTELAEPVEELFEAFEEKPMASASIGQVHRATLIGGQQVVVKVQHAGIEEKVHTDMDIMAGLAELLQKHVPDARAYQPVATFREFRRTFLNELDLAAERRNLEEFARNFAEDETVHFPAVYPELCGRRVLTMERLDGISLEDEKQLAAAGADLEGLALRGANMYLEMIFRDGFYHADPHPGNLMLLPGGVVGVLDCGMVGRIDDHLRGEIEGLLLAVVSKDAEEVVDVVMRLGSVPAGLDRSALRSEVGAFVADGAGQPLGELDLGATLERMTDILRRYRIALPPACTLLLKALVMLEGTGRRLSPTFNLARLVRPYQTRALKRWLSPERWMARLGKAYRDWDRLLEALPRDLADLLRKARNGSLEVRHEHPRLERAVNRFVLGALTAALFVGSAHLWATGAAPVVGGVSLFGAAGCLAAVAFGIKLVRRVARSEKDKGGG